MNNYKVNAICSFLIALCMGSVFCSCNAEVKVYPNRYDTVQGSLLDSLPTSFLHPGVFHTQSRLQVLKQIVSAKDPASKAYQDFKLMQADYRADSAYAMKGPFAIISRDGQYKSTKSSFEADFSAAYLNALMWSVTGEEAYAKTALHILVQYAGTLKEIEVSNDAPLLAGLQGFQVIYATELLSYTYPKVDKKDLDQIKAMIEHVFIPVLEKFYSTTAYTNGNWGFIVTKAYMAAGILMDDHEMYKKAVAFFLGGQDNGTLPNYIDGETGQCQEAGRDQGHAQLGVGAAAGVAELAYQQGTDLYGALDDRLLLGYEYLAKYNLGNDVPYKVWKDVTGKYSSWPASGTGSRGVFRTIYVMAYNHYVKLKGRSMPYTEQIVSDKLLLEGYDADNIGYGTFQFAVGR